MAYEGNSGQDKKRREGKKTKMRSKRIGRGRGTGAGGVRKWSKRRRRRV